MKEKKSTDLLEVGEELEPLEFVVSPDFNNQYLDALEDHHPWFSGDTDYGPAMVHPGLLVNYSNRTRSPSYFLSPGVATVHAKESIEFKHPARVGKKLTVTWKVVERYEKRDKLYSVVDIVIRDEDGLEILKRKLTSIFIRNK